MNRLGNRHTHTAPKRLVTNNSYNTLHKLLETDGKQVSANILGVTCSVLSIISNRKLETYSEHELKTEGSKYNTFDTSIFVALHESLFHSVQELYPSKFFTTDEFSNFIDETLIYTGNRIIQESNLDTLCDLMMHTLDIESK